MEKESSNQSEMFDLGIFCINGQKSKKYSCINGQKSDKIPCINGQKQRGAL